MHVEESKMLLLMACVSAIPSVTLQGIFNILQVFMAKMHHKLDKIVN